MADIANLVRRLAAGESLSPAEADMLAREFDNISALSEALAGILVLGSPNLGINMASGGFISVGGGDVLIDDAGITIANETSSIFWESSAGVNSMGIDGDITNQFLFYNLTYWTGSPPATPYGPGVITFEYYFPTADTFRDIFFGRDWDQDEVMRMHMHRGNNGARITLSGEEWMEFRSPGLNTGYGGLKLSVSPNTPPDPTSSYHQCWIYVRSGKFVVSYNDGGTVRYKSLDMTGTGTTWAHSTTAP